jgi:hypothetical protein
MAPESQDKMSTKRSALRDFFTMIGDAVAVSAAVRGGRQPAEHNLRGLGIDPERFREIRLR